MKINKDTVNYYNYIDWQKNTGNFNGECQCGIPIKVDDTILIESDTSKGLTTNEYCISCGNKRLMEYSDYYKNLIKN